VPKADGGWDLLRERSNKAQKIEAALKLSEM
jgi:hypothetical protein